ncbi:unnamed protein product [Victoria cruziana]
MLKSSTSFDEIKQLDCEIAGTDISTDNQTDKYMRTSMAATGPGFGISFVLNRRPLEFVSDRQQPFPAPTSGKFVSPWRLPSYPHTLVLPRLLSLSLFSVRADEPFSRCSISCKEAFDCLNLLLEGVHQHDLRLLVKEVHQQEISAKNKIPN